MRVAVLKAGFYLHGCASLKDKRRRLSKLRDKFGKQTNLAVCESNYADVHQRGEWSFVATADSDVVVQQTLSDVERYLGMSLDAKLVDVDLRWLN